MKRINQRSIKLGMLVAVNTCDDGQVYRVYRQHPDSKFVYELAIPSSNNTLLSCGYLDCGSFYEPSKAQLENELHRLNQSN